MGHRTDLAAPARRRRRSGARPEAPLLLAALLALTLSGLPAAPRAAAADGDPSPSIVGVWDRQPDPGSLRYRQLEGSGARFVRLAFNWNEIERLPGQYDWTATDRVLRALKQSGIAPVLIVANAPFPGHYTPGAAICGPLTAEGLAAFERFLVAAMRRYGSSAMDPTLRSAARHWQILNEADFYLRDLTAPDGARDALGGGCLGNSRDPYGTNAPNWGPKLYAAMLARAWTAKETADPSAIILFAAVAAEGCYGPNGEPLDDPARFTFNCRFFEQVVDPAIGNAGAYFDVMAMNWYLFHRPSHETSRAKGFLSKVERLRGQLAAAGLRKPIAISETGLVYGPGTAPCQIPTNLACVDRTADAVALLVAPVLAWTLQAASHPDTPVVMLIWFTLTSEPGDPIGEWGLVRQGTPSQAYLAYQYLARELRGLRFLADFGEPTVLAAGQSPGGSDPCLPSRGGPTRRCNSLQWLAFLTPDFREQRHLVWVDSGYHDEPHAYRFLSVGTVLVPIPVEREVGFPTARLLWVTTDTGSALAPLRVQDGLSYFRVTHRAIVAALRPDLEATVGRHGLDVTFQPALGRGGVYRAPAPPSVTLQAPPGALPEGATVFLSAGDAPPGLAASRWRPDSLTIGCLAPRGQRCLVTGTVRINLARESILTSVVEGPLGWPPPALRRDGSVTYPLHCDSTVCSAALTGFGRFTVVDGGTRTFVPAAALNLRASPSTG
jgi:hypothetical protein